MKTEWALITTREASQQEKRWWAHCGVRLKAYPMIETNYLRFTLKGNLQEEVVVFTSKNAVKAVLESLSPKELQNLGSKTIASIAPATSQYLIKQTLSTSCHASNSAELAQKIIDNYSPQPVRYFCKADRLPILPTKLKQAQFAVRESIVYQTKVKSQVIVWGEAKGAIFYSPSAVASFFQLNEWPKRKIAFAIGPTTAQALKEAKVRSIRIADKPSKEGLLASIRSTFNNIYS
ncbi:MAG: uroporphyrinogen-III synthase [Bacteroidota bacterium]